MSRAIPASKATNAYQLLDEIKALADAEPKQIFYPDYACCIGGWAERLTGVHDADVALGLKKGQSTELFGDDALVRDGNVLGRGREHANHVIAHVTKFQRTYRAQLKATPLAAEARA